VEKVFVHWEQLRKLNLKKMIRLTDLNFEKEIQSTSKPILVDFWATWCYPCSVLSPILEKLAKEYQDELILAKVNIAEAPMISEKLGIDQIPTVILFKNGKPISGFIGVRPEPVIREWLGKMLRESKNNYAESKNSN